MPGPLSKPYMTRTTLILCLLALLLPTGRADAQLAGVEMDIQREFLGLGGVVQRGVWTPVRMDLLNTGAENVTVTCRWLLSDEDGDELVAERTDITLIPAQPQGVWLYATPPMTTRAGQSWSFQVVSAEGGELINQAQVQLAESGVVNASTNLVGLCGFKGLGLTPWGRWSTQHEQLRLVRGLNLETLPDRWYGLDSLSSLIWFPIEGGEPTSSRMSDTAKRALREWVYRGGHLVVVMPYAGQQWTSADSGLADLLSPLTASDMNQAIARPPIELFSVLRQATHVPLVTFDIDNAQGYTSLAEVEIVQATAQGNQTAKEPLIVGKRLGFGQVTLVGIDLSDATVLQSLDSFRMHKVWTRILSWRASKTGELLPVSEFENKQTASQYYEARNANQAELASWIAPKVARQGNAGPAVGLAFVLFIVYAVFAALTFPNLLRARGWDRHSWVLFVGIVAIFSAIAWGGAWLVRPSASSSAHFTVLDIDGNTNMVRAKSWQSVLIPKFTTADVHVPTLSDGFSRMDVVNLVASPGHDLSPQSTGYPDRRTYTFDAANPSQVDMPMRSTTKSMVVDYLGEITAQQDGLAKPWDMPQASIRPADNNLPAGTITHRFPGPLHDVTVIVCPGGGQSAGLPKDTKPAGRPLVYEFKNKGNVSLWDPNTPLALPNSSSAYQKVLWKRPALGANARPWKNEGFLGEQIHSRRFADLSAGATDTRIVQDSMLLSFFDALPPPVYETKIGGLNIGLNSPYNVYQRSLVRDLDLTPLITGRRIIIIGHLKDGPSPVPMTIDGDAVDSEGWTVVRWIYDY